MVENKTNNRLNQNIKFFFIFDESKSLFYLSLSYAKCQINLMSIIIQNITMTYNRATIWFPSKKIILYLDLIYYYTSCSFIFNHSMWL
jgi:hypothetical protein